MYWLLDHHVTILLFGYIGYQCYNVYSEYFQTNLNTTDDMMERYCKLIRKRK